MAQAFVCILCCFPWTNKQAFQYVMKSQSLHRKVWLMLDIQVFYPGYCSLDPCIPCTECSGLKLSRFDCSRGEYRFRFLIRIPKSTMCMFKMHHGISKSTMCICKMHHEIFKSTTCMGKKSPSNIQIHVPRSTIPVPRSTIHVPRSTFHDPRPTSHVPRPTIHDSGGGGGCF